MKAGHRLSLQYHVKKDETIHLRSGQLVLVADEGAGLVEKHVRPGESHRMVARSRDSRPGGNWG